MNSYDVYSFGVVSSSTLYLVAPDFPDPEGYAEIEDVQYMTGGEAANSSIVLSRLGARVKLDGNWLGADEGGRRTRELLESYQIDMSALPLRKNYRGTSEVVFAAKGSRTIFGTYARLQENEDWNMPDADELTKAKVVCLDPFFRRASLRAAEIAANAGIPVVTVDCLHDDSLLAHTSAVVISESYLRWKYPDRQFDEVFQEYRDSTGGLVVFTFGGNEIWYARPGEASKTFQPYSVEPVDTSGAGDSFRAGIVYGFLQQWEDLKVIDFAAATAAIVCTRSPGVLNAPDQSEVLKFMRSRRMQQSGGSRS